MSTVRVPLYLPGGMKGSYYNAAEKPAGTARGRRYIWLTNAADSALTYSGMPKLDSTYTSGTLKLKAVVSCPTAGDAQLLARVMATADGEDAETDAFGAEILSSATTLTADDEFTIEIDISSGVAAGDTVSVVFGRNTGIASDVADKLKVWSAWLEYTTP